MVSDSVSIARMIEAVQERVVKAAERSGRDAQAITLIAVSKTQPIEKILAARIAGISHFGENRVQEALAKFGAPDTRLESGEAVQRDGLTLHLIGTLQRNKVRPAARLFDVIQSVDRISLLPDLDAEARKVRPIGDPLPVLLEVNVTGEASKSGVAPDRLEALAEALEKYAALCGVGLMTIARQDAGEAELHRTFASLRDTLEKLAQSHPGKWTHLSMGMSNDFEIAVAEGATMLRVGRALFGER